jgi:hypothetical protein
MSRRLTLHRWLGRAYGAGVTLDQRIWESLKGSYTGTPKPRK